MLCVILYLLFGFWGQYSGAKSQSHFSSSWRNFWILNHLSICTSQRILWCVDLHRWRTNRRFHRCFAHFGSFFLLITLIYNVCLAHIPAATSRHDLTDWKRQAAVDTKHCMRSVPGQSAYIIRRCGLDITQVLT